MENGKTDLERADKSLKLTCGVAVDGLLVVVVVVV
jgi:hypothetical protein